MAPIVRRLPYSLCRSLPKTLAPLHTFALEPTGNLNSEQAKAVVEMLVELNQAETTILLVSHDPRWRAVVDRSVELFDGKIES